MAQRKRGGPITHRSQDRNLALIYFFMFQTNFSFVLSADVLCCSLFSGRLTFAVIRPELYGSEISSIDATNAASRALHLRRPASLVPTNLASSVRANGKMRFQQYRGASGQKLKQTKPSISSPKNRNYYMSISRTYVCSTKLCWPDRRGD